MVESSKMNYSTPLKRNIPQYGSKGFEAINSYENKSEQKIMRPYESDNLQIKSN